MWPIAADELVRICGGDCTLEGLADLRIDAASVGDLAPTEGRIFVPLLEDVADHGCVARMLAQGASLALVDRSWPGRNSLPPHLRRRCVVVPQVLLAYRKLAAHFRRSFSFPVIAIAGSNGKTTTKELVAAILVEAGLSVSKTPETMNGWRGVAYTLCQSRHHADDPPDALVLEIGIDAIGAMEEHARITRPDVAVITALGAEHLDGLQHVEIAAREELILFGAAPRRVYFAADHSIRDELHRAAPRAGDVVVLAAGDSLSVPHDVATLRFAVRRESPRTTEVAMSWIPTEGEPTEGLLTIPLGGAHNAANLACAVGAVLAADRVEPAAVLRSRRVRVAPPSMRCEVRQLACGITLVDDCYNASPASVRAALSVIESPGWRCRPKHLVLGDMLELGRASQQLHHELLGALVKTTGELLLVGDAMRSVADAIERACWLPADASAEEICSHIPHRNDAVVLVKGSRAMRLERVVEALARRPPLAPTALQVAVVGKDRDRVAMLIAEALGRADTGEVVPFSAASLTASPIAERAAVFTGFELEAGLTPPEGLAAEEYQLALMAQPFLHLGEGAIAVLSADDDATPVLAAAVPVRASTVLTSMDHEDWCALLVRGARQR